MYIHEQTTLYVFAGQSYKNLPYFTCQRFLCKSLYLRDLLPPCDLFCLVHTTLHLLHTHPLSLASMSLMIDPGVVQSGEQEECFDTPTGQSGDAVRHTNNAHACIRTHTLHTLLYFI